MWKKILPVLIIGVMALAAWQILQNPPGRPDRKPVEPQGIQVESLFLQPENFSVRFKRLARVQAQTSTQLVARVSGEVLSINPAFRVGGRISKGTQLLSLDQTDLKHDLLIARAGLTEAIQALDEEKARGEDAAQSWRLSGRTGEPSDRVLRKPQLIAARARVDSAKVSVRKAEDNLKRAVIRAPFDGVVISQDVNLGQSVSQGSVLGQLRAESGYELRIALNQRELPFIQLPDQGREGAGFRIIHHHYSDLNLSGRLVRSEEALDSDTLQLITLGRVDALFTPGESVSQDARTLLSAMRPGHYVEVELQGHTLNNVLVIPNTSLYQGSYVYLVRDESLHRQEVDLLWQDDDFSVIAQGLKAGDQLITTSLGQVVSGTRVSVSQQSTLANQSAESQP